MLSPDRDVNRRAAAALRSNPTPIAGLAEFDDRDGDLDCALDALRVAVLRRVWDLGEAGVTVYAVLRVAQQEYGGGDPGYWPHLAARLGIGNSLGVDRQQLLGGWFREALQYFGYPFDVPGLANLGPILWHAGWARNQLRSFLGFVAAQVGVYGARAAEPDAPHALRIGSIATGWSPSLPRTVVRLLTENAEGVGDLWARLAQGVLLAHRGADAVRAAWEPIGGIDAEDVIDALRARPPASIAPLDCPSRPRLRYDPDSGELRFWIVEGRRGDWDFGSLTLRWQGTSALVLPPLTDTFTLTHRPSGTAWDESLFAGGLPAAWFGGRSGALERGAAVDAQGLTAGDWFLICRGTPAGFAAAARRPLALGFYAGGEGWGAWEVTIPERSDRDGRLYFDVQLDGKRHLFPLARGPLPLAVAQPHVAAGDLTDSTRIALYSAPPRVELRQGARVRLIRRTDGEGVPVADWAADAGERPLPDGGTGVYQLRESRGVGRVLLDYAVIPGLGAPVVSVADGVARLTFTASGGRIDGGTASPSGWRLERPDAEPWLEAVWRWDGARELPVRLRTPVRAVRWRLADPNAPLSAWGREPHAVSRRDAAPRRLRLWFEVPTLDVLVNGHPPTDEPVEGPTGWAFSVALDALASVDAVRLSAGGRDYGVAAWLTDRPVLRRLAANANGSEIVVRWQAEYLPAAVRLAVWDPTDPGGREVLLSVPPEARTGGGTFPVPAAFASLRRLSAALGATAGQGFGPARFLPATNLDGSPVAAFVCGAGGAADPWGELAHKLTVWHRWGGIMPAAGAGLDTLSRDPPFGDVIGYAARLPATSPLRSELVAILECCPDRAAEHVAAAADPVTALRGWLALGIHPGWATTHTEPAAQDTAYPLDYLAALRSFDSQPSSAERCRAAADLVYEFHNAHELFSPLAGLPAAALAARSLPAAVRGRMGNAEHSHFLTFPPVRDDADQFIAQTTGRDSWWKMPPAPRDPFRQVQVAAGRTAVRYETVPYEVGWDDGGFWSVGRRAGPFRNCCRAEGPLTAPPWEPAALVEHLKLVEWLFARSADLAAPDAVLPEFDELLFRSPLGAVHRRVLTPPRMVEHALDIGKFKVVGTGTLKKAEYDDTPPAGKVAWRLAWLDRSRPDERATVADWSPYYAALREALGHPIPGWTHLFAACIAAAEYVRRVLAGGIGPVFRYAPAEAARR